MPNSRTPNVRKNLTGVIVTFWLLTYFLLTHPLTVPRVVDTGKTALEPTLVTAIVSSRLSSL